MEKFNKTLSYVLVGCIVILMGSCSRNLYDSSYKGEPNYESFYLVDTIRIVDPVRIHSPKFGGQFIVPRDVLKDYNDKIGFFNRPDVFLLGEDLYRDLPQKYFDRYSYQNNGGCAFEKSRISVAGLEVFEIKNPSQTFLLGLINVNYFYAKHNSYVSFQFSDKNSKITYYKIVYPLCK